MGTPPTSPIPPDRWQRVSQLYHAALARDTKERSTFLDEACGGDEALLREVESLLIHEDAAAPLIETPALKVAAKIMNKSPEDGVSLVGRQMGPYTLLSLLGAGGMGQVYRARDTKLGRDVAIKLLPTEFTADADRRARFEREARLLAALNHPHIAQIYGLEQSDGVQALVMELVLGETLDEIIAGAGHSALGTRKRSEPVPSPKGLAPDSVSRQALPLNQALDIARQIADALDAAHEKGIIHRDLKPANIKVTPDGTVKVLDFGLAKAITGDTPGPDLSQLPTLTQDGTRQGTMLGTPAYMSPEQTRGQPVDKRTDIWAFGCVLYEMLAGHPPFPGDTISDTIAAILGREPDWNAVPLDVPPHVRQVLRRCLQKDRKVRLHDIADVRLELDDTGGVIAPTIAPGSQPLAGTRVRDLAWLAALVIVSAIVGGAVWWLRTPAVPPETRLEITTPLTTDPTSVAISPDGRRITFVATRDGQSLLWIRALDATVAKPLEGTEGAIAPFWSPDSQSIGFFAGHTLKRLELVSGSVQTLSEAGPYAGATWGASNVILYRHRGPQLSRISASGGEAVAATELSSGMTQHSQPQFLPDGRHFLFLGDGSQAVRGVYLGSLESHKIKRLTDADAAPRYLPGWLLFIRQGALVARRFDIARESLADDVVLVAEDIGRRAGLGGAAVSVSAHGVIAYRPGAASQRQLVWFDRTGKALGTLGEIDDTLTSPELSPDGSRVAVHRTVQGNEDIWVIDPLHRTPFTSDRAPARDVFPLWSPGGSRIAFWSNRHQGWTGEYVKSSNGPGDEDLLFETSPPTSVYALTDWSRDGFILVDANATEVWVFPVGGDRRPGQPRGMPVPTGPDPGDERKPHPFVKGNFKARSARFSPDGRWVAYHSDATGRPEIYIRPFPGPGIEQPISTAGGAQPRWRNDGKELYWIAPDAKLMAATIAVNGSSIKAGSPVALFQTHIYLGGTDEPLRGQYNVARDGRFLINTLIDDAAPPIIVVQNWRPK
jgi:serine/threonine protein kinase/Tol biopolymer transport system component